LAFTSLGFPAGEIAFPVILGALLPHYSAAAIWAFGVCAVTLALIPLVWFAAPDAKPLHISRAGTPARRVWLDSRLYWLMPSWIGAPVALNGLVVDQSGVGAEKNCGISWWIAGITACAAARAISSVLAGGWLSQRPVLPVLPWVFLPALAGTILI